LLLSNKIAEILIPSGKTGARRVSLIPSVPYLVKWLEDHPYKSDPEAWLWVKFQKKNGEIRMNRGCVGRILEKLKKKANIKKRIYPHLFRHSAITKCAKYLTESQLKERFGWVMDSDMASVYVHLSGRDVDESYKRMYGLKEEEEKEEKSKLMPIKCQICGELNPPTMRYCCRCARPLTLKTALENLNSKEKEIEVYSELREYIRKLIMETLREMNEKDVIV